MRPECVEGVSNKYDSIVEKILKEENVQGNSHFTHITGNLLVPLKLVPEFVKRNPSSWEDWRSAYVACLRDLRTYLRLLNKNPDFCKAEKNTYDGFFVDMSRRASPLYVREAEKRLQERIKA